MEGHAVQLFGIVLVLVGIAFGEVIKTQKCYLPAESQSSCTVHEVRVNPCPEAAENKPCKVKLGANSSISFDFTPTFSATSMSSQAFKVSALVDIPSEHMDTNGCLYTTCPLEANKKQVFNYGLEVDKKYSSEAYQVKWKLWNNDNRHQLCCFKLTIELVN